MATSLSKNIALVTGASRGVGKGVALGLGETGATVYVTGRSVVDKRDAGQRGGTASITGLVRTESVMKSAEYFDLSNSESPQFIGRAVAALARDPDLMRKTGKVCVAAELGLEYGFTDLDGRQPKPLTAESAQ